MKRVLFIILFFVALFANSQIFFEDKSSNLGLIDGGGITDLGNGISFVDFDNDGWDDITIASGNNEPLRFYKNNQGTFVEVNLLVPSINYQTRATNWVDIDNDGDKDLYVTSDTNGNRLYENTGNLTFIDITQNSGLPQSNILTYGTSWGDINNDGYLDIYISNRTFNTDIINHLFKNDGDGTFTDVTISSGLNTDHELTFCSGFFDFNNDGWQDLYIANDKTDSNLLYKNNGDGTFSDVSLSSGTDIVIDAMSVTVDDFNNDGFFDIYITNTPHSETAPNGGNVFLRNNGDETFTNIAIASGTFFDSFAWGAVFFDADNDMDLDLYVSGMLDGSVAGFLPAAFYQNEGNETFIQPTNIGFVGDTKSSFSNAIGDVNNDGKTDVVVFNNNDTPFVWMNQTTTSNNYLAIKLEGVSSNEDGIGSVIEVGVNGGKQYRYTMCGEGYLSQNSSKEIFGLGNNTIVDYVKVTWLSGTVDVLYNISANQVLNIVEGSHLLSNSEDDLSIVTIFPNPVKESLLFKSLNLIDRIYIYNMLGQELIRVNNDKNNYLLSLLDLQTGTYIAKVIVNNKTKIIRFIKE
ncbi:FG-GAP-like repeat-containing protein [Ichthyenterobacterium magnum]|uniref:Putative secreted protein (Por secretion system target) n=1 Tax=Ichthyenterobacterium magnum TaxID=1230530 RepID=A0A420DLC8_9FLAO|nr:FG-GAP-like repeat-containing protein [Ichthyenterobacterium magnum]RKE95086.1 putative secreted protein (Por secretion system target) [Ichthyenterobacterium magnum]